MANQLKSNEKTRQPQLQSPGTRMEGNQPLPLQDKEAILEEILRAQAQEALGARVGRNEPCPCGSGKKYKKCCLEKHRAVLSKIPLAGAGMPRKSEKAKLLCEQRVKQGYDLLGTRRFQQALSLARSCTENFPQDDRFRDIMVTALLQLDRWHEALEMAQQSYDQALSEKQYFLSNGSHSWEAPGKSGVGHAYAPEAWLERVWVTKKAVEYQQSMPPEPDQHLMKLVRELHKAENPERYPQGREQGLQLRKEELAPVLEELKKAGPKALAYLLPLCPKYGWSGLLVPELLVYWASPDSIRALIELAMFRYPYLSESCLKGLEDLGENSLPHLQQAFLEEPEMDPLKTGLLSVAGEIGTPRAMQWLVEMLDHPLAVIVNWTAGILGRKAHKPALPRLLAAKNRVGNQPYIIWAIEQLQGDTLS